MSLPTRKFFGTTLPAFVQPLRSYSVRSFDDKTKVPQKGFICAIRGPGFNIHPQKVINVRAGEKIECFVTDDQVTVRIRGKKRKRRAKYTRDFIFLGVKR